MTVRRGSTRLIPRSTGFNRYVILVVCISFIVALIRVNGESNEVSNNQYELNYEDEDEMMNPEGIEEVSDKDNEEESSQLEMNQDSNSNRDSLRPSKRSFLQQYTLKPEDSFAEMSSFGDDNSNDEVYEPIYGDGGQSDEGDNDVTEDNQEFSSLLELDEDDEDHYANDSGELSHEEINEEPVNDEEEQIDNE